MLSSLIHPSFERITYCLGTWKNSSAMIWLGWSVEKVKCVHEKERLIFCSALVVAVCRSWQRKWKWPQVSGSHPCCSHINDSSQCIISPSLSLCLSFLFFRLELALFIPPFPSVPAKGRMADGFIKRETYFLSGGVGGRMKCGTWKHQQSRNFPTTREGGHSASAIFFFFFF